MACFVLFLSVNTRFNLHKLVIFSQLSKITEERLRSQFFSHELRELMCITAVYIFIICICLKQLFRINSKTYTVSQKSLCSIYIYIYTFSNIFFKFLFQVYCKYPSSKYLQLFRCISNTKKVFEAVHHNIKKCHF